MSITILHRTLAATATAVLVTAITVGAAWSAGMAGVALAALGATGGTAIGATGVATAFAFLEVRHQRGAVRIGSALERGLAPPTPTATGEDLVQTVGTDPLADGEYVNAQYRAAA